MAEPRSALISSPDMPPAALKTRSGNIVRPHIIRELVRTSKVFETAGKLLDELERLATKASQSGVPPPPYARETKGGNR